MSPAGCTAPIGPRPSVSSALLPPFSPRSTSDTVTIIDIDPTTDDEHTREPPLDDVPPSPAPPPPTWQRLVGGLPVAVALVLNLWGLSINGFSNTYYAAAARSMASSWHNFIYGAFDPGGFITVDKPPLTLWVQALSVKIFGFSSWSLLVPSALAGALAVALLFDAVRRVWGRSAGLVAGFALAVTPVTVAVSRHNNPDAILVLFVALAAWALERAISSGRFRWLAIMAVAGGLGFLAKMLAAYIVLPALWGAYLLVSTRPWKVRLTQLAGAAGVLFAVSASWIVLVDLTPASSRPYIGGSTNNTARDLVFGYNGLGRVDGTNQIGGGNRPGGAGAGGGAGGGLPAGFQAFQECMAERGVQLTGGQNPNDPKAQAAFAACQSVAPGGFGAGGPGGDGSGPAAGQASPAAGQAAPAAGQAAPAAGAGAPTGGPGGGFGGGAFGGSPGWKRFFGSSIADQVLWLVPFGLVGLVLAAAAAVRRRRLDAKVGSLVMWGGWFVLSFVVFSLAKGIFHPYYVSLVAPGAAALAGIGFASIGDVGIGRRWRTALGVVGLALTTWLEIWLVTSANYATWLRVVIAAVVAVAALALILADVVGAQRLARLRLAILGVALAMLLVGPALWSAQVLRHTESTTFPSAGPRDAAGGSGLGGLGAGAGDGAGAPGSSAAGGLAAYLKTNWHGERWVLAVSSSMQASTYIIEDDLPVMAMGGFSGSDKAMTAAKLADLVTKGELRYISTSGAGGGGGGGGGAGGGGGGSGIGGPGGSSTATAKVATACAAVPASAYGGTGSAAAAGPFGGGVGTIYDCRGHGSELA